MLIFQLVIVPITGKVPSNRRFTNLLNKSHRKRLFQPIKFWPSMIHYVLFQLISENFYYTNFNEMVWFCLSVNVSVVFREIIKIKTYITHITLKGFCTSVIHSVLFGEIKEIKTFITSITLKWSCLFQVKDKTAKWDRITQNLI